MLSLSGTFYSLLKSFSLFCPFSGCGCIIHCMESMHYRGASGPNTPDIMVKHWHGKQSHFDNEVKWRNLSRWLGRKHSDSSQASYCPEQPEEDLQDQDLGGLTSLNRPDPLSLHSSRTQQHNRVEIKKPWAINKQAELLLHAPAKWLLEWDCDQRDAPSNTLSVCREQRGWIHHLLGAWAALREAPSAGSCDVLQRGVPSTQRLSHCGFVLLVMAEKSLQQLLQPDHSCWVELLSGRSCLFLRLNRDWDKQHLNNYSRVQKVTENIKRPEENSD